MLSCPKCGRENNVDALECINCGIVFEKYTDYLIKKTEQRIIENKGAKKLKRRILFTPLLIILYVPAGSLVHTVSGSDKLSILFILIYLVFTAFFLFLWLFSICPRCGKYFFYDWFSYRKYFRSHPFRKKCINCGFSIK